jgi:hypothetical protein
MSRIRGSKSARYRNDALETANVDPPLRTICFPNGLFETNLDNIMFWVIFVALLILWAVGVLCHVAFSNLALVIALIVLIIRLVRGRAR